MGRKSKIIIIKNFLLAVLASLPVLAEIFGCQLLGNGVEGNTTGAVAFTTGREDKVVEVHVEATIKGVTGSHGFHIHEVGSTADNCNAAGGHWNPKDVEHGCPLSTPHHEGDLGNVTFANGYLNLTVEHITWLTGRPLVGHTMVLHAGYDDCVTQPTGNAGSRIACCVIRRIA